jgi:hypothetical protein
MITTHYSQDDFKTGKQAITKNELVERILNAKHNSFVSYETPKGKTINNFKLAVWKEGELKGQETETFTLRYGRQEIMLQPYDEAINGDKESFIEECKEYVRNNDSLINLCWDMFTANSKRNGENASGGVQPTTGTSLQEAS